MGKRRKKSKKASNYPNPLNSLLDFAGGLTMGIVADHMENKYHYTQNGKINPYAVSAFGIASGKLKTTEDLIRTGAILGALGSFDVDEDDMPDISEKTDAARRKRIPAPENPIFNTIKEKKSNDNRYAWRLNAKEGLAYGISPYDFETRAQYTAAILNTKENKLNNVQPDILDVSPTEVVQSEMMQERFFVKVSRLDNGNNQYYWSTKTAIKIGNIVSVETDFGTATGVVIAIEKELTSIYPMHRVIEVLE